MLRHKGTVKLESERLLLRRVVKGDAPLIYKNWASDERVTEFLTWSAHQSVKVTEDLVDGWVSHYTDSVYLWLVTLKELGEPIGMIDIRITKETEAGEFGYCVGYKYWGRGIITEAMLLIFKYLFNEVGFKEIIGYHNVENVKSGRVMQKIGMKPEGVIKNHSSDNKGNSVDDMKYVITKEDYDGASIREAFPFEVAEVGKLYRRLTDYLGEHGNFCGWRSDVYPTPATAKQHFDDGGLFVAVKSGEYAASFVLNDRFDDEYFKGSWRDEPQNAMIIHTLVVDPEYQRCGLAKLILEFCESYVLNRGMSSIRLDTNSDNIPAISLYSASGYEYAGEYYVDYRGTVTMLEKCLRL